MTTLLRAVGSAHLWFRQLGPVCLVLVTLVLLWSGTIFPAQTQDVDQAMQAFIQAMGNKDSAGILAAFSRQSPWRYQPYEIGTGRRLKPAIITPARLAQDFQKKSGLYDFFHSEPNGYTFRVNFMGNNQWRRQGPDTFIAPDSTGDTYIKWRQEKGGWVIGEIGETTT
jgi:hypothetical protein